MASSAKKCTTACFVFFAFFAFIAVPSIGLYDPVHHVESARLYGNIDKYAYWFVDLLVGIPPQITSVVLDTGSEVCAFPCTTCVHCGHHIDRNFDFARSGTAKWTLCGADCFGSCEKNHCAYHKGYQGGSSISGYWFRDWVQLGDHAQRNPPVLAHMGCHQNESNIFYTQKANGILGVRGSNTLLQALFQDRVHIESKVFAICLSEWGGRLVVGGHNKSYHEGEINWIPLAPSSFGVPLTSMRVSGSRARKITGFGRTIVDSGATFVYMSSRAYRSLRADIEAYCREFDCGASRSGTCWNVPSEKLERFPMVEVTFGRAATKWEPRSYLFRKASLAVWCYAFQDDGPSANTVLGASWMLYHEVIFDLRTNKLGIVQANCPEYRNRMGLSSVNFGPLDPGLPALGTVATEISTPSGRHIRTTTSQVVEPEPPSEPEAIVEEGDSSGSDAFRLWLLAGAVGLCIAGYCGRVFLRLRRKREQEHMKVAQEDDLDLPPQILGEPTSPSTAIGAVDSEDESHSF